MATRRGRAGTWLPVVAGVAAALLAFWFSGSLASDETPAPAPAAPTSTVGPADPADPANPAETSETADTLPTVELADLPPEAADTVDLIDAGGPFPYEQDDGVFGNFEGILPDEPAGYYREYTVETPGSDDRGARRIVAGSQGELYWTADHYQSFERIER